jgi:Xaa-Pro aminopeptidase
MFQSFDDPGGPQIAREHLPLLRAGLAAAKLDGVLVPHEDEYQNEYVPAAYDRLAWASGFTGSAGGAVVLLDSAFLITDGRYRLQASAQTPEDLIQVRIVTQGAIAQAMADILREDGRALRIGYDPKLFSPDALALLRAGLGKASLIATDPNPIDAAWGALRPPIPLAPVSPQPLEFTGEDSLAKRQRLAASLSQAGCDSAVLTAPASIAWLFNIRGGDVARTPLPLGAAFLHANGQADLFLAPEKTSDELRVWLGNGVVLRPESEFAGALRELAHARVRVDPASASAWHFEALAAAGAHISPGPDPCALPRACKNPAELDGSRAAHRRDGAALTRFLHWLDGQAQTGPIDEITACTRLEAFRKEDPRLRDLSFDSISGAGPNGAIIHYRVNTGTNRRLEPGSLFLIDSGGQYLDGTTDVTRTLAIGTPNPAMRRAYTLVLKGHIALAMVRFPPGTSGRALDALARAPLWAAGLDYDHGTGHGVGSYLGVHEGPQRIAKQASDTPLEAGMILSNEPGYYLPGGFGIRIENLQAVTAAQIPPGGERPMHCFETLTLAPLDRRLIDAGMLSPAERDWLNAYHARVLGEIGPLIPPDARAWLEGACAVI